MKSLVDIKECVGQSAAYAGKCLMKLLLNQYRFNRTGQNPKLKHCMKSNLYRLVDTD